MRDLVLDRNLGSLVAQLEDIAEVRLCFDSLLAKRPFAMASRFHLDLPHWSVTSVHAATIWIAVDNVDATNGCMCYLPGTHLSRRCEPVDAPQGFRDLFERYPDWVEIAPVFCPMIAGDAVIHHALTAHGSTANFQPGWRRAMSIAYVAADATFTGHRSPLFAVPDDAGPADPLPDIEHPVVFRQS
jgi:ectoine hydroxylase-related dioxygenase (phytanoyl-CoA dioxygenase family)